ATTVTATAGTAASGSSRAVTSDSITGCARRADPRGPRRSACAPVGAQATGEDSMKIRNVSHIAVGVRDMERSLAFYRDVLGLHVSLDAIEELPSIAGAPPIKRRGVYLRWREGRDESFIVLDQQLSQPPFGEPPKTFQVGTHHWGLWVDDVDAMVARAEAA